MQDESQDPRRREELMIRLRARLAVELGGDRVLDAARHPAYAVEGRQPGIVICPETPAEVAIALEIASDEGAAVTPWGGGTQMALGYPLARLDVVLSLERLARVVAHDSVAKLVTVRAGMSIAALNKTLAPLRQMVALDGPLSARATVGGRLATGAPGLRRAAYGTPSRLVQSLLLARSDGTLIHTGGAVSRHDVPGHDLNNVLVGSLGTLGVIIETTLHTTPRPESEATVALAFDDASSIWALLDDLATAPVRPTALVACGPGCVGVDRGLSDSAADALQPAAHLLLLVRLAGAGYAVRKQALAAHTLGQKFGATGMLMLRGGDLTDLWEAVEDLPATVSLTPEEAVIKVRALPSEIGTVVEMARDFGAEHGMRLCWLVDASTGLVWLRVVASAGPGDPPPTPFGAALHALQGLLVRRWRNVVVAGCAPALKPGLSLWGESSQGLEVLRALKSTFDPKAIMNPGRLTGQV